MSEHDPIFARVLTSWIEGEIAGVALVDRRGDTVARAGTITADEAMPLAALVLYHGDRGALTEQLFAGEVMTLELEDRDVAVAVARRQLFVVVALAAATPHALARVRALRDHVASYLADLPSADRLPPWNAIAKPALFSRERAKA